MQFEIYTIFARFVCGLIDIKLGMSFMALHTYINPNPQILNIVWCVNESVCFYKFINYYEY